MVEGLYHKQDECFLSKTVVASTVVSERLDLTEKEKRAKMNI